MNCELCDGTRWVSLSHPDAPPSEREVERCRRCDPFYDRQKETLRYFSAGSQPADEAPSDNAADFIAEARKVLKAAEGPPKFRRP